MENKKIVILNLDWHTYPSRDREMITPIINYLRLKDFIVFSSNILDFRNAINTHNPDVALFSNVVGSEINYSVSKYCHSIGIRVISLISEGYLQKFNENSFYPIYSDCRVDFVDLLLLWNYKSKKYIDINYKDLSLKSVVVGNSGVDRFVFTKKTMFKDSLLNLESKYKRVIAVGLYNWSYFYNLEFSKTLPDHLIQLQRESRDHFNKILIDFIESNPNYLFILRRHPGSDNNDFYDGIEGLSGLSNVMVIKNEISLLATIDICDYWFSFDSTTALEAMVRGKKVVNIRPVHIDDEYFLVSNETIPHVESLEGLKRVFDEFNNSNEYNQTLLNEVFGRSDGFNHVRAVNVIINKLYSWSQEGNIDSLIEYKLNNNDRILLNKLIVYSLIQKFIPKTIKERSYIFSRLIKWDNYELMELEEIRLKDQIDFYSSINIELDSLTEISYDD